MTSFQTLTMSREHGKHQDVITLDRDGFEERFISARRGGPEELSILDGFPPASGAVVAQMVFGGCRYRDAAGASMSGARWPLLWLQGDACSGSRITGAQAFLLHGVEPRRIVLDDRVVGSAWSDADAEYCLLAGVLPADRAAGRGAQTRSCFEQIEAALERAGMDFSHVARTWLYLDQLLAWYGEFNEARTGFFQERGVFDRLIPASTGIGASNPAGAALVAGALAIRPRHGNVRIQVVESPLQRPATEYRSSFSRAVEIESTDHRTLLISGTASISPDGRTLFAGDAVKQIHRTLDVVEAILDSRGMDWRNTTRAIGYFHDFRTLPVFDACCQDRGMPRLPMAPAHATVCRHDLLFEIELDAIASL